VRQLPRRVPTVVWDWGVCATYRDPDYLQRVVGKRDALDAKDVLELPIRPVDKLWVLMRLDLLPIEVLQRATERILVAVPAPGDATDHQNARERARLAADCRKSGDYWGVSRHVSATVKRMALRASTEEHQRQLQILTEEIAQWLKQESSPNEASTPGNS
jgi:hypothetical protein